MARCRSSASRGHRKRPGLSACVRMGATVIDANALTYVRTCVYVRTYTYVHTYVRTYFLCTHVRTYVLYHLRTYVLGCSADFATRMYVRTYVVRTVSLVAFLATAASAARVAELAGRREGLSKEQLQAAHDCLTNGSKQNVPGTSRRTASTFSTPLAT